MPHATGFIDGMQRLIAQLVAAGKAYVVEGQGVYFEVAKQADYGKLSHRNLDDLVESAGARVDVDERKRSPVDFALWKAAKPGEPTWDSPWGPGRPGWHIECSAMSLEILGDGFDLHGGGDDLVFPHHENEIAQAEGAGHEFARYWLHSAMVNVGGEKMSKSLGNFSDLADALDEHGPRAFRLLVLQTHYRRTMEINDTQLKAARTAVEGLDNLVRRAAAAGVPEGAAAIEVPEFVAAMDDDFGTPEAIAAVFSLANEANAAIDAGDTARAAALVATVRELAGVLGLEIGVESLVPAEVATWVETQIAARNEARTTKDWAAPTRSATSCASRASSSKTRRTARCGAARRSEPRARRPATAPRTRPPGRTGPRATRVASGRDDLGGEQVEGRRAVRELLRAGRRRVRSPSCMSADAEPDATLDEIAELAGRGVAGRALRTGRRGGAHRRAPGCRRVRRPARTRRPRRAPRRPECVPRRARRCHRPAQPRCRHAGRRDGRGDRRSSCRGTAPRA